ncbi:MAG: type IV toxin-antitoxin system AbiEi family antitoxin [bacterium]|nr:type IV toxin-antitoxin system AbiEi family antitoxin [bacterium]
MLDFNKQLKLVITVKLETELIRKTEQALCRCLSDVSFVKIEELQIEPAVINGQPDMLARLKLPSGETNLVVVVKSNGQPRIARGAVDQIIHVARDVPNAYGVFIAPYISPKSAEICTQQNIGYLDFAGNCRLSFWPVYIKSQGENNPFAQKRGLRSLYSPSSVKTATILRLLLENPKRVWKIRELADTAGVSLGQASNVKRWLEDREWLQPETEGFLLTDPSSLLSDWADNYDSKCNMVRDFYSMKSIPEIESDLAEFCGEESIRYALTGIAGGARYAPAVRYQRTTAYIADYEIDKVATALGLKEVPTGANARLMSPCDENVFYGSQLIKDAWIASPTQVYLDLRNTPGRGEEAAEALLRKEIEPKWR